MTIFTAFGATQHQHNDPETVALSFPDFSRDMIRYLPIEILDFDVNEHADRKAEFRRMLSVAADIFQGKLEREDGKRTAQEWGKLGGRPPNAREEGIPHHRVIPKPGEPGWYTTKGVPVATELRGVPSVIGKKAVDYMGITLVYRGKA